MPSATTPQADELDKLLDYDNAVEDFLRDIPMGGDGNGQQSNNNVEPLRDEDQEVEIKRKRKPIPKLDENRLLSDAGIPRLRKIAKTQLKFRGKSHEFSDIWRLLNTYQLWLDDLYPRAKFRDALTMVEKVGHSKRMQVMRRAWLDGTKPYRREPSPDVTMSGANGSGDAMEEDLFGDKEGAETDGERNAPPADELDDLLAEDRVYDTETAKSGPQNQGHTLQDDEPDADELDDLLAENDSTQQPQSTTARPGPFDEDEDEDTDEDEPDALMAEQHTARPKSADMQGDVGRSAAPDTNHMDDFADDEEALASMGW